MQVLAVGIQWGIDHAKKIKPCECDPEVGFFCVHCCLENQYIQDLKNKFIELKAENARLREALEFTLKAAEYVFQPDKPVHKGLDPTFYHTLTYEGDMELIEKTKKAREALKGGE
jgi:hypothetical protein